MDNKQKNKQVAKISVFITSVFVIFLSISYAFITDTLTGEKSVVVNVGVLDLVLEEENEITLSNALPMYDEVGMIQDEVFNFKLVNNTENDTNYKLMLNKVSTYNELSTDVVKYYLTKDGVGEAKLLSTISSDNVIDEGTIEGNKTINYTLRLWIDSSVDNNDLISGKSLSYKLNIEASQESKKQTVLIGSRNFEYEEYSKVFPDFTKISSLTNGRGVYKYTEDGEDIYYFRGKVLNNNVLFAGYCWKMIRTTSSGGVKMIYNGLAVDGKCRNEGVLTQLEEMTSFNLKYKSIAYLGYMYGNDVWEYYNIKPSDDIFQTKGIVFANDVDWNGTNYILKEDVLYKSVGDYQIDKKLIANANHYTCFSNGSMCDKISYIYSVRDQYISYIELENGVKIEDAFDKMNENDQDSKIKETLEKWFSNSNLIDEENFSLLEDAVYCADRSTSDENISGWYKDGNALYFLYYSSYYRRMNGVPNLDCGNNDNNRDRFTYRDRKKGNALLKYPVGLLTADEAVLAGANFKDANFDFYLNSSSSYWIMSAGNMNYNAYASFIKDNGSIDYDYTFRTFGIRPVITLASFVEFDKDSDGTSEKPYVVK